MMIDNRMNSTIRSDANIKLHMFEDLKKIYQNGWFKTNVSLKNYAPLSIQNKTFFEINQVRN